MNPMVATGAELLAQLPMLAGELSLLGGALVLLLVGLYGPKAANGLHHGIAAMTLLLAGVFIVDGFGTAPQSLFNNLIIADDYARFAQLLILGATIMTLALSHFWMRDKEEMRQFEFPLLILLATLGMLLMVQANDLLSLYIYLELMSLSLYILAAFRRDSEHSAEAGLKYFVLGSLASGLLLYGISLVYGFSGSTQFSAIADLLQNQSLGETRGMLNSHVGVVVGMVLVIIGFAFKLSAAPFHMWTPDVYEGAPTPVTAFFASAPKVAAMALFGRLLLQPFGPWLDQWQPVVVVISIASMLVGAFGALRQSNIKRMLAYSSIGHVGFALMGVAAGTVSGLQALLVYLAIYVLMTAGVFACVILMRRNGQQVEQITDLQGLSRSQPALAFAIAAFMFSLAGIPPLAGFLGKFTVFLAALHADLNILAVVGVLSSVVAAYYYLRVVKLLYFDEPAETLDSANGATPLHWVLVACSVASLLLFALPHGLLKMAMLAARAVWL